MVYIKLVNKDTGQVKKMNYPRLASAKRAARKRERDAWNPYQQWKIEGIYYNDGRVADPTYKKGFHEGLADVLARFA